MISDHKLLGPVALGLWQSWTSWQGKDGRIRGGGGGRRRRKRRDETTFPAHATHSLIFLLPPPIAYLLNLYHFLIVSSVEDYALTHDHWVPFKILTGQVPRLVKHMLSKHEDLHLGTQHSYKRLATAALAFAPAPRGQRMAAEERWIIEAPWQSRQPDSCSCCPAEDPVKK